MTAAARPVIAPLNHGWAWIILLLALFFGSLPLAAVAKIKVDCANEYLTGGRKILTGGGKPLATGRHQYWLVLGSVRVPVSVWVPQSMGLSIGDCR
jgi:hypothetical protein